MNAKNIKWTAQKKSINDLKLHEKNPRIFTEKGMKDLENSIKSVGFFQPIVINLDGTILSGHARYLKLKEMGETEIEVMLPDRNLTEKQEEEILVRANANTAGKWDFDILANQFDDFELTEWGLEVPSMENLLNENDVDDDNEEYQNEDSENHGVKIRDDNVLQYNQFALFGRHNNYDIPVLKENMIFDGDIDDLFFDKQQLEDENFVNKVMLCIEGGRVPLKKYDFALKNNVVGFFADDFRFEKVWINAIELMEFYKKNEVKAMLTPNFSLWADEPLPFQILSHYKTQWCGRFWQEAGMKVVPTINFSTPESYDFCFLGVPTECPLVFFQVRNVSNEKEFDLLVSGIEQAYKTIKFKKAYFYGAGKTKKSQKLIERIKGDFKVIPFPSWTDRLKQFN
jgi:hypothetical protein